MHPSTRIQEGFKFGGVVLPKIKISVFGAKMLSSLETPGISPDTQDLGYSGGNSEYRPGNSGLRSPDTPDMNPDIPDFIRTVGCRIG
jgi:hypothetical protein